MGFFKNFELNEEESGKVLQQLEEDFKRNSNEKTAASLFKSLATANLYVPIVQYKKADGRPLDQIPLKELNDCDPSDLFPGCQMVEKKWNIPVYTIKSQCSTNSYLLYMPVSTLLKLVDHMSKLGEIVLILDPENYHIVINDAFIRYMKSRTKFKLW